MSFLLGAVIWVVIGTPSAAAIWVSFQGWECPSPRAILGMVGFGSLLGGILALAWGLLGIITGIGYFCDTIEKRWGTFSKFSAWFVRPVCK